MRRSGLSSFPTLIHPAETFANGVDLSSSEVLRSLASTGHGNALLKNEAMDCSRCIFKFPLDRSWQDLPEVTSTGVVKTSTQFSPILGPFSENRNDFQYLRSEFQKSVIG